jgi:hypothetical protein
MGGRGRWGGACSLCFVPGARGHWDDARLAVKRTQRGRTLVVNSPHAVVAATWSPFPRCGLITCHSGVRFLQRRVCMMRWCGVDEKPDTRVSCLVVGIVEDTSSLCI